MQHGYWIGIAAVLILVVGPLLLGLWGLVRARHAPADTAALPWNWKLTVVSALLYTLAFNLTFFLQELFLVLPKAFTPGLRPTLFHNNHAWDGDNPLAALFQGTGALAILVSGIVCVLLLRRGIGRSVAARLFLVWMAYCGCFMALPQVVVGALSTGSDVGMAMEYLRLVPIAKTMLALLALAAIPPLALWLVRPLLGLADNVAQVAGVGARARFMFQVATLPALVAILMIIPFRVPREPVEVVMVPLIVSVIGIAWIQAGAWRIEVSGTNGILRAGSIAYPLVAVLFVLLVFQVLLRPGIPFY